MSRACLVSLVMLLLSACTSLEGPPVITIDSGHYQAAFAGTLDVLRAEGLPPTLRDPRSGVIEAGPAPASGLFEPWYSGGDSSHAALESTIHHQRRRVRVEFTSGNTAADPSLDLTTTSGAVELRVQAWLERAYEPGRRRRNLWSRRLSDETVIYAPGETEEPIESRFWLPVRRDAEYESHLMGRLAETLGGGTSENIDAAAAGSDSAGDGPDPS